MTTRLDTVLERQSRNLFIDAFAVVAMTVGLTLAGLGFSQTLRADSADAAPSVAPASDGDTIACLIENDPAFMPDPDAC